MELGALEVQIFVSLTLVLGAVFVALVCDFLKGNNEVLREHNVELAVRHEERQRREVVVATAPAETDLRPATSQQPATVPANEILAGDQERESPVQNVAWAPPAEVEAPPAPAEADLQPASDQQPEAAPRSEMDDGDPEEESPARTEAWASPEELDHVDRMAGEIKSQVDAEPEKQEDQAPTVGSDEAGLPQEEPAEEDELARPPAPVPVATPPAVESAPIPDRSRPSLVAKVTPIDAVTLEHSAVSEALQLVEELARVAHFSSSETPEEAETVSSESTDDEEPELEIQERETPEPELQEEPAPTASATEPETTTSQDDESAQPEPESELSLPTGIQSATTFSDLLARTEPFRGTVFAVGVAGPAGPTGGKDAKSGAETLDAATLSAVTGLIESLLTPRDLASRTSRGEFILVCPNESGPSGQKRIQQVSQQLWDIQIRSLGASSATFNWGAVEARGGTIASAVETARERMRQTMRNRQRRVSREIPHYGT